MKNNSHQDLVSNQRNVYNVIYETKLQELGGNHIWI